MFRKFLPYLAIILILAITLGIYPVLTRPRMAVIRAEQLLKDGNSTAALLVYNGILSKYPNLEELYPKAGMAAWKSGEKELARSYLGYAQSRNLLGPEQLLTLGDAFLDNGEELKAETTWRKALVSPVMFGAVYRRIINSDIQLNDWQKAKNDAMDWLRMSPKDPEPYELQGWVTLFINPLDSKLTFQSLNITFPGIYKPILEQINGYPETNADQNKITAWWMKTGDILDSMGESEYSLDAYAKATQDDRKNALAWIKLAIQKQKMGLDGKSEAENATQIGNQDPNVSLLAAEFWSNAGETEMALIFLHKTLELDAQNIFAMTKIGWLLADIGNVNEGITYIKRAALMTNTSQGWANVVRYCLLNGVFLREEAIPAAREALRLSPNSPEILDLAGQVFLTQDDLITSERYLIQAVAEDNGYYSAHLHLAYVYIKQGSYDLARSQLDMASDPMAPADIRTLAARAYSLLPVK